MIGHGVISSYEGSKARVLSLDIPGHITSLLVIPEYIPIPPINTLVAYAEFDDNFGVVLAVMKKEGS